MKSYLFIFLTLLALSGQSILFAETTPSPNSFEPTFPVEDLVGKPGPQTDKFFTEFLNMLATLGLIIALILLTAWFLKRMVNTRLEQANLTSAVKILEQRTISTKTSVYLLDVEGTSFLIAESANGVTKLGEFATPDFEKGLSPSTESAFKKILDAQQKRQT